MGVVRFLLALSVLVAHSTPATGVHLLPGNLAVELFFIISGFYMAMVLSETYTEDTAGFYINRFLRLWPAFIIVTLAVYLWLVAAYFVLGKWPLSHIPPLGATTETIVALVNTFMIGQDVLSLLHFDPHNGVILTFLGPDDLPDGAVWLGMARKIGPAWSIGAEIWFYLLAPWLVKRSTALLLTFAGASLVLRYVMNDHGLTAYFFFPAQLALFLTGMLAYRYGSKETNFMPVLCVLFVVIGCFVFGVVGLDQRFKWFLYAAFAATMSGLFAFSKSSAMDRNLGELSYPIYLSHLLVLTILATFCKRIGVSPSSELLALCVVPLSWLMVTKIEAPINRYRETFRRLRASPMNADRSQSALQAATSDARSSYVGGTS